MTKYILIAFFSIICNGAMAQNKPLPSPISNEKFTGIGIFKLGTDTSVVYDYAKSCNVLLTPLDNDLTLYQFTSSGEGDQLYNRESLKIVQRLVKSERHRIYDLSDCPDVREYYISEYEVAGIKIYNLRLKYYQNKLFRVEAEYNEKVNEALDAKYGKGNLTTIPHTTYCLYKLTGHKEPLEENTYVTKWINGNIKAEAMFGYYYDDHCEKQFLKSFFYEIAHPQVITCEDASKPKKEEIDKKSLDKF